MNQQKSKFNTIKRESEKKIEQNDEPTYQERQKKNKVKYTISRFTEEHLIRLPTHYEKHLCPSAT